MHPVLFTLTHSTALLSFTSSKRKTPSEVKLVMTFQSLNQPVPNALLVSPYFMNFTWIFVIRVGGDIKFVLIPMDTVEWNWVENMKYNLCENTTVLFHFEFVSASMWPISFAKFTIAFDHCFLSCLSAAPIFAATEMIAPSGMCFLDLHSCRFILEARWRRKIGFRVH